MDGIGAALDGQLPVVQQIAADVDGDLDVGVGFPGNLRQRTPGGFDRVRMLKAEKMPRLMRDVAGQLLSVAGGSPA